MADFYAARAGTNAGAPLDGFLTAVHTEIAGGRYIGAIGGALDFLRGARASQGGVPIIALPSTAEVKGQMSSRIVAGLSGPATIGRADASIVVTEYGVADLRGLSLAERVQKMVAIAHPDFRDTLGRTAPQTSQ